MDHQVHYQTMLPDHAAKLFDEVGETTVQTEGKISKMKEALSTCDANLSTMIPPKCFTPSQAVKTLASLSTSQKWRCSPTPSTSEDDSENERLDIPVSYPKGSTLDLSTFHYDFHKGLWPFFVLENSYVNTPCYLVVCTIWVS